jgi:Kef-type K+ transport system membrane component KefB
VSIAVPILMGAVLALGIFPLVGTGSFTAFALFMGAAMAITAFPVLAGILRDTRLDRTKLGTIAITCAAVDDVTAWCILPLVVASARSTGNGDTLRTLLLTVAFGAVMLGVVRPLLAALVRNPRVPTTGPGPMAALIGGVLLSAWATDWIGIHLIFGAFLAGVVVPRDPPLVATIVQSFEDLTRVLLLPIFFAVVGLTTSIGLLDRPILWALTGLVIVVAVASKWGGSTIAARACGLPWDEAAGLGVLMNARGLTELVILTVGRDLGIISPGVFAAMVIMAIATTLMATPLAIRLLDPDEGTPRPGGRDPRHPVGVGVAEPAMAGEAP